MAGNVDSDLAYAAIMNTVFRGGGVQQIQQAVQSAGDPVQALGAVIFQILEMAKNASQNAPVDPKSWIQAGGVIDRVVEDICQLAASMGVQGAEDRQFGLAVKENVVAQMKGGGAPAQPPAGPPKPAGLLAREQM